MGDRVKSAMHVVRDTCDIEVGCCLELIAQIVTSFYTICVSVFVFELEKVGLQPISVCRSSVTPQKASQRRFWTENGRNTVEI